MTVETAPLSLEQLVESTRGAQPWRKVFHGLNGVLVAAVLAFGLVPTDTAVTILVAVLGGLVVLDLIRLGNREANLLFFRVFGPLASPREAKGMASSTWYALGILTALTLFPTPEAISGILVLGLADPTAGYVGRRWGGRPFLGGTTVGTLVFVTVALLVLAMRHPWPAALAAALFAALAERLSWPLDDNFTVPLVCAGTLAAAGLFL